MGVTALGLLSQVRLPDTLQLEVLHSVAHNLPGILGYNLESVFQPQVTPALSPLCSVKM